MMPQRVLKVNYFAFFDTSFVFYLQWKIFSHSLQPFSRNSDCFGLFLRRFIYLFATLKTNDQNILIIMHHSSFILRILVCVTAFACFSFPSFSQDKNNIDRCTVTVADQQNAPIPGASVIIDGTTVGAYTDSQGRCYLENVPQNATLSISCLGYSDKRIGVQGQTMVSVKLETSNEYLDELVVIGYGTQRKRDLTGSVAKVKGETLTQTTTFSGASALQGRVSGVRVIQNDGRPGGEINVVIRGSNSLKGSNAPLWIINGFPGTINIVNPEDIESIEVLKDASATAIYGSRGANGVILVTTKSAKDGKIEVEYNGSVGIQSLIKKVEMCDANEYMEYLNAKAVVNGTPEVFSPEQIAANRTNTDWQDEVFKSAPITSNSISIRGGNNKIQSALSASYFDQEGIIRPSDYRRLNIGADIKYNVRDWLQVFSNIMVSRSDQNLMSSTTGSRASSVTSASLLLPPTATPYNEDGSYSNFTDQPATGMNPIAYLKEHSGKFYTDRTRTTAGITLKPLEGLTIQFSGNIAHSSSRTNNYTSRNYTESSIGSAAISLSEIRDIQSNNIITYDRNLGEKHHITLMGGMTYETDTTMGVSTGTSTGFISDVFNVFDLEAAENKGLPGSSYSNWKIISFLGRINYNYDNRFLLTASWRADGSSRFSRGHKWGYFPSMALAWRISQEDFMKSIGWISELKVRVGYGKTGSTAVAAYSSLRNLETRTTVFNKEVSVCYTTPDAYNGNLKWETTSQSDAGIDAAFFDYRLRLTADVYYKKTTDLLCDVDFPRSSGYTTGLMNIGSVQNKGFELQVDGTILDGPVKWDAGFNFSLNRSKVLSLANHKDVFRNANLDNLVLNDRLNIMREGEPMFSFYGYLEDGYDENGYIKYKDLNEDGNLNTDDKTIIGNPNPDFLLNFNTSVSWKNLTLSAFFQGVFGNDLYSMSLASLAYDYAENHNVLKDLIGNWWTKDNPDAKYPNLWTNETYKMSDRWVVDGTYLRLKNLELSYSIPVNNKNIKKAVVYLSGQNILTFTNYPLWDPDVNVKGGASSLVQGVDDNGYPSAKTYSVGCRIKF